MIRMRGLVLACLVVSSAAGCRPERASDAEEPAASDAVAADPSPSPDRGLPASAGAPGDHVEAPRGPSITPAMRQAIHDRMIQHGRDMARLQRVTLDLEYDLIEQSSAWLAEEPAVPRPEVSDRALLRAGLPPRFFQLEAELRGKAIILRGAARVRDDEAIALAYGRLVETCVRCHSLYRAEERAPDR